MNDVKRVMKLTGLTRIQAQAFLGLEGSGYDPTDTDEEVAIRVCNWHKSRHHTERGWPSIEPRLEYDRLLQILVFLQSPYKFGLARRRPIRVALM